MIDPVVLKENYMCAGLSDSELDLIGQLAAIHQYPSGHLLAKIGEDAVDMYIVLSGNLTVTTHDGDKLGDIAAGSVVGEVSLVDGRPRTANVVCVGPTSVASLNLVELRKVLRANPSTGFVVLANISRVLATRLRNANAMIDHLADKADDVWTHALG